MSLKRGRKLEKEADQLRQEGQYIAAGETYSIGAFECFGDSIPSGYATSVSFGQEVLLESVLCFAIADETRMRENRAKIGCNISDDIIARSREWETTSDYDNCRLAAWFEFKGDFQLIGDIGDHNEWYSKAEEVYIRNGDPSTSLAEQEHLNLFTFFRTVDRMTDEEFVPNFPDDISLSQWLSIKKTRFPQLIDQTISSLNE